MAEHRDFENPPLRPGDLEQDPMTQFKAWFAQAQDAGVQEPEAMSVATTAPSVRTVYVRTVDDRGFAFFTNYDSAKGQELSDDPRVALQFAWLPQHRVVRVTGVASRLPDDESDAYFAGRPRGSQLGAWASPQSQVLADEEELARRVEAAEHRFPDIVPRPPFWGGILVRPETVEFWQGRPSRLHDRLRYVKRDDGWRVERLAP